MSIQHQPDTEPRHVRPAQLRVPAGRHRGPCSRGRRWQHAAAHGAQPGPLGGGFPINLDRYLPQRTAVTVEQLDRVVVADVHRAGSSAPAARLDVRLEGQLVAELHDIPEPLRAVELPPLSCKSCLIDERSSLGVLLRELHLRQQALDQLPDGRIGLGVIDERLLLLRHVRDVKSQLLRCGSSHGFDLSCAVARRDSVCGVETIPAPS